MQTNGCCSGAVSTLHLPPLFPYPCSLTWHGLPGGQPVEPFDAVLLAVVALGLVAVVTARQRLTAVLSTLSCSSPPENFGM